MREKEARLFPAVDMWTSGAEMLPVLLEELKSASLPEKQRERHRERSMKETRAKNGRPVPCLPGPSLQSCVSNPSSANIPELPKALCFPGAGKGKHKTLFHKQPGAEGQADGFSKSHSPADYNQRPKQGKESQPSLGPSHQQLTPPKV